LPLPGIGVAPAAGSLYTELASVNRRAFVPKLFVQIYFGAPSLFYMIGNAQRAAGGLNQVTVPMQGNSMVQVSSPGAAVSPAPSSRRGTERPMESAYWVAGAASVRRNRDQATDREISLLKARMNDVYAVTRQNMARLSSPTTGEPALAELIPGRV
jgi:hypothetical protein